MEASGAMVSLDSLIGEGTLYSEYLREFPSLEIPFTVARGAFTVSQMQSFLATSGRRISLKVRRYEIYVASNDFSRSLTALADEPNGCC